jgi:hypothetical protein
MQWLLRIMARARIGSSAASRTRQQKKVMAVAARIGVVSC